MILSLKSNLVSAVGLMGSWGTFALSLFEKTGILFQTSAGDINLVTIASGLVSASLTAAIAYAKYIDASYKKEEIRTLKLKNDSEELKLKKEVLQVRILEMQIDGASE